MKTLTLKRQIVICTILILYPFQIINLGAQNICTDENSERLTGNKDGYRYELWNQNRKGTACISLGKGCLFSGKWEGIENYLARRGYEYDQSRKHTEIGKFHAEYDCNYSPIDTSGNSYLAIYGWTVEPLAEYYIIEDWCRWIPSMDANAIYKGSLEINGSNYDIYENTRINQPSIVGNTTFKQYFSIRKDKRTSGTIDISSHFKKWEKLDLNLGKLYEVSFVVEGYKSSGSFEFKKLEIVAGK